MCGGGVAPGNIVGIGNCPMTSAADLAADLQLARGAPLVITANSSQKKEK